MKIVVTGSLGHIGNPLASELVQRGHFVTVISSDPEKRKGIEALGAIAAIGSVEDISFLKEVLPGADAVFCLTPPKFSEPDQITYYERIANCYAEAIRYAAVKRVVYLSSYGAHLESGTGFITGSHRGEKVFDSLPGINLTHIRAAYFYYNLLGFIQMIKSVGFIGAVYGEEDQLALVSPVDIAAAVAEEITQPDGIATVRYVASDDRSCNEVALVLGRSIGIPDLQWRILPEKQVMQSLLANGFAENVATNLIELGRATHQGILREDFDRHTRQFGKVSLEDFTKKFATVYNNNNNLQQK